MKATLALLLLVQGCYLSHELDDAPPELPPAEGHDSTCTAALQLGAPAPMVGYCPTRAGRSPCPVPDTAPAVRWTLDLPVEPGTYAPIVVGSRGRLYTSAGTELLAIDDAGDEGLLAWRVDLGGAVRAPLLLSTGSIFTIVSRGLDPAEGVWLRRDGSVISRRPLVAQLSEVTVDRRGGLVAVASTPDDQWQVVRWTSDGEEDWRTPPLITRWPRHAIAPGGHVVVLGSQLAEDATRSAWLVLLDGETGERLREVELGADAIPVSQPAVADDGSIHLVLWTAATTLTTLVRLSPEGEETLRVDLPEPPWGGGTQSLTVAPDGTVFVKEGRALMAVAPDGSLRWQREVHPNIDLAAVIDPRGRLLIGSGAGTAIDAIDGTERWVSDVPAHSEMTPGGGVLIHFPGSATVGEAGLYYFASPARLEAVGEVER